MHRADQLLQWTEQQQLNANQLQLVKSQFLLAPAQQHWLILANRVLLLGGVVLLCSALLFFFAYNWPLMPYLAKFVLAAAALLLSGSLALISPPYSLAQRGTLFASCLLTGALLALIGQTYQTGADTWQLFASWAALIMPLVMLSKSRAAYLLWFTLLELTLWRYVDTHSLFWLFSTATLLLYVALANVLLLILAELALPRLGIKANKPLVWLAALALLLPLTIGAIIGVWEQSFRPNLLCYLLLSAIMTLWYLRLQRDIVVFALLLFSAIAVATSMLASLFDFTDSFFALNLLALFVITSSAGASIWLKRLLQEHTA
ncbi:hypothetical protein VT06_02380 [Arsukibacterium sp. MJ3]|nr:hypothetical protein VT06_02380 [Arsukibacterium sp. MJ3]